MLKIRKELWNILGSLEIFLLLMCELILPSKCFFFLSLTAEDEARGFWTSAQHVNLSAISKQFPSGAIQTV